MIQNRKSSLIQTWNFRTTLLDTPPTLFRLIQSSSPRQIWTCNPSILRDDQMVFMDEIGQRIARFALGK